MNEFYPENSGKGFGAQQVVRVAAPANQPKKLDSSSAKS
jgi:hypothetical protein